MRARTDGCSFYSRANGAASSLSDEGPPALRCGTAPARQARSAGEHTTYRWARGGGTARHALPGDGLAFLGDRREGDRRLVPRGGGTWPARTPRRRNALRAAQGRQAERRHASGALERGRAVFQVVNPLLTTIFSKKLNCATKTVDTKLGFEQEAILCFFSTV
jgi:hypothetical protein